MANFQVRRFDAPLGAEILGVDLSKGVNEGGAQEIKQAFADHSVIVFRNQHISEDQHIEFSKLFGTLEVHVGTRYLHPKHPEIRINSNIIENGKPIGATDAGQYWHTDLSYMANPSKCSLLYALEVPHRDDKPVGDTCFVSAILAYDALPHDVKRRITGKKAIHSYEYRYHKLTDAGQKRPELTPEQKAKAPDVVHPVVITHEETGKNCLYVNEGFTTRILDIPDAESRELLDFLFEHVKRSDFMYRHKWRVGDLLMWDNMSTQHFAVADYALPLRRRMQRTTVMGAAPH
jgi:taurine dioxygenase